MTRERDTVSSRNCSQRRRTDGNAEWQKLQMVCMRAAYAWRDQATAMLEPHAASLHYFLTDLSAEQKMEPQNVQDPGSSTIQMLVVGRISAAYLSVRWCLVTMGSILQLRLTRLPKSICSLCLTCLSWIIQDVHFTLLRLPIWLKNSKNRKTSKSNCLTKSLQQNSSDSLYWNPRTASPLAPTYDPCMMMQVSVCACAARSSPRQRQQQTQCVLRSLPSFSFETVKVTASSESARYPRATTKSQSNNFLV